MALSFCLSEIIKQNNSYLSLIHVFFSLTLSFTKTSAVAKLMLPTPSIDYRPTYASVVDEEIV